MTQLKHSIVIDKPLSDVYALARQVERYPEFMKDYLYSRIVEHGPDGALVERAAIVKGKHYAWKSRVTFEENHGVYFVHQEGPLHGMQVSWVFDPVGADQTRLTITHRFSIKHPLFLWGRVLELWDIKPKINDVASRVIVSFKHACEGPVSDRAQSELNTAAV